MADRSEMARNAIESDFGTYKMAAEKKILYRSEMAKMSSGHFVKNKKNKIKIHMDLKWPEMPSKVNFGIQNGRSIRNGQSKVILRHTKWPPKFFFVSI